MKVVSYIQNPDRDADIKYFDIDSTEFKKMKEFYIGFKGYISLKDDNGNELMDSVLCDWVDSVWAHILDFLEQLIEYGYGSAFLVMQSTRLVAETYSKTKLKFFVTDDEGEVLKQFVISSQEKFVNTLLNGAYHFFTKVKEHFQTTNYDRDISKTLGLLHKTRNYQPVEKYFYFPSETNRINTILFRYSEEWKEIFDKEREYLYQLITENDVNIQHIGSTAIPTISSRPIVDIVIGTKSKWSTEMVVNDLWHSYFPFRSKFPLRWRCSLKKGVPPEFSYHIYITEVGTDFWNQVISFRDMLLTNPDVAKIYNERKLYASHDGNLDEYEKQKAAFIEQHCKKNPSEE